MPEALTLAHLKIDQLEVTCARCDRRGRYRVQRLIETHGLMKLPDLRLVLAADCPNAKAARSRTDATCGFRQLISPPE